MNSNIWKYRKGYLLVSLALFLLLLFIAIFVRDQYIRPIGGDFLVVIFLYTLVRSFVNLSKMWSATCVLLFAYLVEIAQYYKIVDHLGLTGNRFAEIVIGTTFSWEDMVAYTVGVVCVYLVDVVVDVVKDEHMVS